MYLRRTASALIAPIPRMTSLGDGRIPQAALADRKAEGVVGGGGGGADGAERHGECNEQHPHWEVLVSVRLLR
jgi:hypothetical protein